MVEFIIEYWLAFAFSGIAYLFRHYLKKLDTKLDTFMKEQIAMKAGVQAVLRDRIIQSHKYLGDRGYATIEDRDNIFNMYEQYHILGANGVIDSLMDDICELPVRKRKDGGSSD